MDCRSLYNVFLYESAAQLQRGQLLTETFIYDRAGLVGSRKSSPATDEAAGASPAGLPLVEANIALRLLLGLLVGQRQV